MAKVRTFSLEFKKQKVSEYLHSKDKYKSLKDFALANNLNESTFGSWVIQYEPLLVNSKASPVYLRDCISIIAPFSVLKIVTTKDLNPVFYGPRRDIDNDFFFLYGDRNVEMMIPGVETTIIFS